MAKIVDFKFFFLFSVSWLCGLTACRTDLPEPEVSLGEFQLEPGFRLDCIAAEPLLDTPVALDFDEKNRIWAVEMPGYMPDVNGAGEDAPAGKVVILEDRDGDGRMDTRKVFLDSLVMVRAIALVHGGLLYAEPPNLFFVEIQNDRPGQRLLVDSAYAPGFNPEYQANGLRYGPDNWIYNADSGKRYRFKNNTWETDETYHRGQWGLSHDEWGRLVYNTNSVQLLGDHFPPGVLAFNENSRPAHAMGQRLTADQRVYPAHPTLVNRGYQPGELDSLGRLRHFTSACGPEVYLGDQFPAGFYGNAFVCAPEANLLKRNILKEKDWGRVVAEQAYEPGREFLVSTADAFRPVNLRTGPDGCLYVVDMRRGVIQHRAYMSLFLKNEVEKRRLDTLTGMGRIYRVCFDEKPVQAPPDFTQLKNGDLVKWLAHANGHLRLRAQRTLIGRKAAGVAPELEVLVKQQPAGTAALHALFTLDGLGALSESLLLHVLHDGDEKLAAAALTLLPGWQTGRRDAFKNALLRMMKRENPYLDYALLATLGRMKFLDDKIREPFTGALLVRHAADTLACEMALCGMAGQEERFLSFLTNVYVQQMDRRHLIFDLLNVVIADKNKTATARRRLFEHTDERTAGLQLYRQYCAACHRAGGEGTPHLAPPLLGSAVVNGPRSELAEVIWNGKSGPVLVEGEWKTYNEPMQAFRRNPAWNREMLEAVVAYVKNAFADPE